MKFLLIGDGLPDAHGHLRPVPTSREGLCDQSVGDTRASRDQGGRTRNGSTVEGSTDGEEDGRSVFIESSVRARQAWATRCRRSRSSCSDSKALQSKDMNRRIRAAVIAALNVCAATLLADHELPSPITPPAPTAGELCSIPPAPNTFRGPEREKTQACATDGPERDLLSLAPVNTTITPGTGALTMSQHPNFLRAPRGLWMGPHL